MSAFWHFIECIGKALIQVLSLTEIGDLEDIRLNFRILIHFHKLFKFECFHILPIDIKNGMDVLRSPCPRWLF